MVIVARSRSVHGPWENHPRNPIARTPDAAERWWSRGHATLVPGPGAADDDWWMVSHGYENGYRTLGRQILLEPIQWAEDDWPEAAVARPRRHRSTRPRAPPPQHRVAGDRDDFSQLELGSAGPSTLPAPARPTRVRVDDGLVLRRQGHLARPTRRRSRC